MNSDLEEQPDVPKIELKRARIISILIVFIIGGTLLSSLILLPIYSNRNAIIVLDQVSSPVSSLDQLKNGTIWVAQRQYAIFPSLDNEMAGNEGNIYAPDIIYENGTYHMWYGGQSSSGHDSIFYATSADGRTWTKYGTVIPTGENNHVNDPSVVKVNDIYYMYYTVAPIREMDEIWVANSTNGINWTVIGAVLLPEEDATKWDSLKVGRPSVLYQEGIFKMWFDGSQRDPNDKYNTLEGSGRHVGYATSLDGYNWTKWTQNPIINHSGAIDVKYFDGKYIVVEESGDGILYRQGTNETEFETSPKWLFKKMGNEFDAYGHVTPFILIKDGRWIATYTGAATVKAWDRNRISVWYPQLNNTLTAKIGHQSEQILRPWAASPIQSIYQVNTQKGTLNYQLNIWADFSILATQNGIILKGTHTFYYDSFTKTTGSI